MASSLPAPSALSGRTSPRDPEVRMRRCLQTADGVHLRQAFAE